MATATALASLSGATAAGAGATVDFTTAKNNVSMALTTSGTVDSGTVSMEGSHDGAAWVTHRVMSAARGNQGCDFTGGAYRYWRANVLTDITGGGSVTATFMEAG